ncbi:MAG TPA: hypothetical protein VGN68_00940 [Sphingopyxis sp.]|uniref:hypothetical protein n=1 Tax=Sphingopyxis sp. TaxID=1908224 RepID=UPI002E1450D5|nr:hypothetical protein [Sphingopyxis sp.]
MDKCGHNGLSDADRIADYLDQRACRFREYAAKTGSADARTRASALLIEAGNIRAGLIED